MEDRLKKPLPELPELPAELACFHPTNPAVVAYRQALKDPEMAPLEHWIAVAKFYDIPPSDASRGGDANRASHAQNSGPRLVRRRRRASDPT